LIAMRGARLLVDGVFHEKRVVPSLGIAAIAGYVRQAGLAVDMFSPNIGYLDERAAAAEILRRAPSFIGLSLLTHITYKHCRTVLSILRDEGLRPFICVGGHFGSLAYETVLRENPEVSCVIVGDGEQPCLELLRCLEDGTPWQSIAGLAYRAEDGQIRLNAPRSAPQLDSYPMMALDFLEELVERYGREVRVSLVSSRGCYADCSYCSVRAYSKLARTKPYRMRSVERIADEILLLQRRYGVRNFALEDDNFLVPGPIGIVRARSFRDAIVARGVAMNLFLQTRPECITYEALVTLKEIGLCDIFIGTESFDQATLDLYHRNNTVEQTLQAFEVFEQLGFSAAVDAERRVRVGSMVFHPYVTLDALHAQAAFFRRYQIPSKKLIKHIFPVEDVDLCKRFEAEGLLQANGRYRFRHQPVQDVYDALCAYYDRYMSIREDIRRIEKVAKLQQLALPLDGLCVARRRIEDNFIDLFEVLCLVGHEGRAIIDQRCEEYASRLEDSLDITRLRQLVRAHLDDLCGFAVHD
jgi:anaerobic magnesium-protoporphyrin IX monomethyl ester cyclase